MPTRRDALRTLLLAGGGLAAGPALAACGSETAPGGGAGRAALTVARSSVQRAAPRPGAVRGAAGAVSAFTADLFRAVAHKPGNVQCSPYSVAVALAMTRNGARGETAAQMDRVLHAPELAAFNEGLNALTETIESRAGRRVDRGGKDVDVVVGVANSLWGQRGMEWEDRFLDDLARHYGAGMHQVDYVNAAEAARREINRWVHDRTHSRIPELLPPGVINRTTLLALVNALYVKAPWLEPFDRGGTRPRPFTRSDGTVVQAPAMRAWLQSAGHARGAGWQAVNLPYVGGQLAMAVVLPDRGHLAAVERSLDGAALTRLLRSFRKGDVRIQLPRWRSRTHVSLGQTLSDMGMPVAFSDSADFSGMSRWTGLAISEVVHEAFVAVDEVGTEAAAATAVLMRAVSLPAYVELVVDRTFLYVIHDVATATPLFIGRVDDPTAA